MIKKIPIHEMARIILPGGRGLIAVLQAYFDMSATEPHGITSIAGYVAPESEWQIVENKWQAALDYWRIEAFHLSRMTHLMGHERAPMAIAHFENIIKESKLDAIGAALIDVHWHQEDWFDMDTKRLASPYHQCLDMALGVLVGHVQNFYPEQNVAVICDSDAPEDGIIASFKEHQVKYDRFATITVGRANQHIALQCADLGAGKLRKNWLGIVKDELPNVAWGQMPTGGRHAGSFWSLSQGVLLARAWQIYKRARDGQAS